MDLSPRIYNTIIRPRWYNKKFTLNILEKQPISGEKKVLDFGCGTGSNCILFKPANYLGVDLDIKRIEYARHRNPGYNFQIFNNNIDAADDSYDLVLIIAVLHHIPDKELAGIVKELRRVLKYPSGTIIVLEPCLLKKYLLNNYLMKLLDRGKYIRGMEDYLQIFRNEGFVIKAPQIVSKMAYKEILFYASKTPFKPCDQRQ